MLIEKKLVQKLRNHKLTADEIAEALKVEKHEVMAAINILNEKYVDLEVKKVKKNLVYHIRTVPANGNVFHISGKENVLKEKRYGVISDIHFASKFHLPKTFHETMKIMEDQGVKRVYVAGDIHDGINIYRGHLENLIAFGVEDQTDIAAEALNKHPNLEFWGIAGNHDYSFTKQNGAKPLAILEAKAYNFKNLGDFRADIIIDGIKKRPLHGASGRAYATSYPSQTYLRDLFKGSNREEIKNMPQVLMIGHYHTFYFGKDHGMFILQPTSFQDGDNEYCLRKGLCGPNGGFIVDEKYKNGEILEFKTNYVQPRISKREKGKAFSKTTINY